VVFWDEKPLYYVGRGSSFATHFSGRVPFRRSVFVEQQRVRISKPFETRIGTFRTCPIAGCGASHSADQQSENRDLRMAEFDRVANLLTGRQAYFLDVAGTDSAAALSVVSFEATEKMGAPTEVRIVLTHPLQLAQAD
jgi:type VI secretion system secreted protein VgrG